MARPRKPLALAKLDGSAAHNPQRYRDRREPKSPPIGDPPAHLPAGARAAWRDFARRWPWLTEGDRALLEVLCELRRRIREEGPPTEALAREYRMLVSAFGGTPVSRSRVATGDEAPDDDDPFAAFEGGPQ